MFFYIFVIKSHSMILIKMCVYVYVTTLTNIKLFIFKQHLKRVNI